MEEQDDYYEVEHILDIRQSKKGSYEIKIKWLGYSSPEDDTWEPYTNLNQDTCFFFLREYRAKLQSEMAGQVRSSKSSTDSKLKLLNKVMRAWKKILKDRGVEFNDSEKVSVASGAGQSEQNKEGVYNTRQKRAFQRNESIINEDENNENTPLSGKSKSVPVNALDGVKGSDKIVPEDIIADYSKITEPNNASYQHKTPTMAPNDNEGQNSDRGKAPLELKPAIIEDEGYKIKHKNIQPTTNAQQRYIPQPPPPPGNKKKYFNRTRQNDSKPQSPKQRYNKQPEGNAKMKPDNPPASEANNQAKNKWKWIKQTDENIKLIGYLQNDHAISTCERVHRKFAGSHQTQKSSSTPQLKWHIDEKDQIHVPSPKIFPQPTIPLEDLFHYDPKTAFSTINQVFKSINSNILDFSSLTQSILKAQPLDTPPHI